MLLPWPTSLTLFHPPLTPLYVSGTFHIWSHLGPLCELFLAPGIISPTFSHSCLLLIQLLASVSCPFRRLFLTKLLGWLLVISNHIPIIVSSEHLSLVVYLTLLHSKLHESRGLVCLLNTVSPEGRKGNRSLWVQSIYWVREQMNEQKHSRKVMVLLSKK